MKFPYLAFYVGDWLKDPKITLCQPATRGIWMDLLCIMHEQDRSGVIAGTREQLARLGRCSTVELAPALDDLKNTGAAEVTERGGIVTLVNRRMQREANKRKQTSIRVTRHRSNGCVTPIEADADVEASVRGGGSGVGNDGVIPTIDDVMRHGEMRGVPLASRQSFFDHHEGNNLWVNQYGRVINWRHKMVSWGVNDRAKAPNCKPTMNGADTVKFNDELGRVIERLRVLRGQYADHQTWTAQDLTERTKLLARRTTLKQLLGVEG